MKHQFSLLTICLFLLFSLASLGPDDSTNTSVAIKDCESKPQFAGILHVNISYMNSEGEPITEAPGTIFIVHQEVSPGDECTFTSFSSTDGLYTGPDGAFSYNGNEYFHDNSQDLFRVEVVNPRSALYTGCRQVQVQKYNSANFNFKCVAKRLNDL